MIWHDCPASSDVPECLDGEKAPEKPRGDEHWWSVNRSRALVRARSGRAFELVCLLHVDQILRALGVWGVSVNACAWRSEASDPGAQIDLVLDRADGAVNICEMKWVGSGGEYTITKAYSRELTYKAETFAAETGIEKAPHLTMVTPGGVKRNVYWNAVAAEIAADDLFAE